jgi:hypothetical protein
MKRSWLTAFRTNGGATDRPRVFFFSLALLSFVIALREAPAEITPVPPFVGTHSETWESFGHRSVPNGTFIFGGIATISGNHMVTDSTFMMCTADAIPSDGGYLLYSDRPTGPWTISFSQPVSAFGAYWGDGVGCPFPDAPIILTFRDVQGNVVGMDSFMYTGDGPLTWRGYRFSTPVTAVTRTAGDGKEGFAVDGLQAIVASSSPNSTQLANISTRGFVQTGDNVLIGGFIVTGANPKEVLLRALGPTLGQPPFNVPNALADPVIQLHMPDGTIVENDNWQDDNNASYIPAELRPTNPKESAILRWLGPGGYTAVLKGANNATGNALVEVYDFDDLTTARLSNLSTRCFVQKGDSVVIAGLIVNGSNPQRLVIRGLGPSLAAPPFNVPQALVDPFLDLRNSNGGSVFINDNWKDTQEAQIRATGLAPSNASESAIDITVVPGNYTAILSGINGATGNGLVEVYALN